MTTMVHASAGADLHDALRNKGTAFTAAERALGNLEGLLPPRVESLDEQARRVMLRVRALPTALDQYRYLTAIRDDNETLFYRVVVDHLDALLPIVYTPTVGQACLEWSHLYERPRGLYLSAVQHRGRIAHVLRNWPRDRAGIIVVTDGGRILGLGDLGANGMGIPIGKLALYTACAGVPPALALPILLDVGTDNDAVRSDPLYLGERMPRLTGAPYETFIDEFVTAVQQVWPGVVLQFEDFNNASAFTVLDRYRDRLCCFNDDIQGTGAMALAGLYAAGRVTNTPIADQRILFVGAGEACLGIGRTTVAAMMRQGLSESDAKARCLFVDSKGVVTTDRRDLPVQKRAVAQDRPALPHLSAAIEAFRPTALIGACGQPGQFTRPVLEAMARLNARPIVFALSNPTTKAECTAEEAYGWTAGRALFASGSPFRAVAAGGRMHTPAQANNAHVFPGVGLGLLVSGARRVTDAMFFAAANALAAQITDADLADGRLFPPAARMRDVAAAVAIAVADVAYEEGLATNRPADPHAAVERFMYAPTYAPAVVDETTASLPSARR